MSYELAVQQAIFLLLKKDKHIRRLTEGVFDFVDKDQKFPYITIGDATHSQWDTDNTIGSDCVTTVHVWARGGPLKGRKETKQIQGAIYDALHRAEAKSSGFHIISIDSLNSQTFIDADGLTHHGVQDFRVIIERV